VFERLQAIHLFRCISNFQFHLLLCTAVSAAGCCLLRRLPAYLRLAPGSWLRLVCLRSVRFFIKEKVIFLRQHEGHLYNPGPYLLAKLLTDLPFHVMFPLIYAAIVMPMTGLQMAGTHFVTFWGALVALTVCANTVGICVACLIVNDEALAVAAPLLLLPVMMFSGLTAVNIPGWLSWIGYAVYLQYGLAIMMTNEYAGQVFVTCEAKVPSNGTCTTITGEQYLSTFDFQRFTIGENFAIMAAIAVIIQLLAWIALERLVRQRKA